MTYTIGQRVAHVSSGTRGTVCEPKDSIGIWVQWDDDVQPVCMAWNFVQPANHETSQRERHAQMQQLLTPWGKRIQVPA